MQYNYEANKEYQKVYQKTSQAAREARQRYYQKNKHRWNEYGRKYRSTREGQLRAILNGIKHRAKRNNLPFDLDIEWMLQCPEVCPVLGIPILFHQTTNSYNSPSVDRINPNKGYTKDNTMIISDRANTLKSNATIEELEKILQYMKNYT